VTILRKLITMNVSQKKNAKARAFIPESFRVDYVPLWFKMMMGLLSILAVVLALHVAPEVAPVTPGTLRRIGFAPVGVALREHVARTRVVLIAHSLAVAVAVELEAGVVAWRLAAAAGALSADVVLHSRCCRCCMQFFHVALE